MVIDAVASGDVDPSIFISHSFELEDFDRAFRTQLDRDVSLKVMLQP
jgi:threonine dehydrogenase-like Zn-dependent dehydrogenase